MCLSYPKFKQLDHQDFPSCLELPAEFLLKFQCRCVCHFVVILVFFSFDACSECDSDVTCGAVDGNSHMDIVEMVH